ncbi:MAG TPA: FtsX-like permease family protein [Steroidobacteraceae bacterium]|jgi:putative ABC transport system permease protein
MDVRPIFSALRRNKVGAILVALQIALTLAVIANAGSIIRHHWTDMSRPSGLDEANVFSMSNQWVGQPADLKSRIEADVAALRALPGVVDADATNSFPLSGRSWVWGARVKSQQTDASAQTTVYIDTVHGLAAQGLRLVAGRWFTPDEVTEINASEVRSSASVVLTAALAKRLFPKGQALGQTVYITGDDPERVVGIVERASSASGASMEYVDFSTFAPGQIVSSQLLYVIRTRPGEQASVMRVARQRLLSLSRMRILGVAEPFAASRTRQFEAAAATSWLLATVCVLMLVITACGTVGLTMLWVAQRRRQIGTRRALGARRIDILRYFHTENLLISAMGAALGIVIGLAANLWLANHLAMARMSPLHIILGALVVLVLSQLAVLWPAIRATAVPPSLAARGL